MYPVGEFDSLVELRNVPQSDVGAPRPMILCSEEKLLLAYHRQFPLNEDELNSARDGGEYEEDEACLLVKFNSWYAYTFGPPNDEALRGHPLFNRGLQPYAVFEVRHSSWIRSLETMNQVHRLHKPERFGKLRHFIFTFHDSTFECAALDFTWAKHAGGVSKVLRDSLSDGNYPSL
jgi:hypothetical protein